MTIGLNRPGFRLLTVALVVLILAALSLVAICQLYLQGMSPLILILEAAFVVKIIMVFIILLIIPITVLALVALIFGRPSMGGRSGALGIMLLLGSGATVMFGLLGAAYSSMGTAAGIQAVGHAMPFDIIAPSVGEALMCLALGLLGAVIGLSGRARLGAAA